MPDDIYVEVPSGETILGAAQRANVYVNSICGGDGICGKCKVVVESGAIESSSTSLLSRDEIQRNYVLACDACIHGNVEITIPQEARLEESQILTDEDSERFGVLSRVSEKDIFEHDPLVKKIYVELEAPSMESNAADHDRLYQALANVADLERMQTGYRIIKQLSSLLKESDWKVTATLGYRGSTTEVVQLEKGDTSGTNLGIAIDVGTTTVVAELIDLTASKTLDVEAKYNSQMRYGEDYIRRIMYAGEHDALDLMQELIVKDINGLISVLLSRNDANLQDIMSVTCAGNTAMLHFLLGLNPEGIRREPYVPAANFVPPFRAAQVGIRINSRGLLYCLPSVAAYVGSDITAGSLAVRMDLQEDLCLFIDIGTNGEVLLGNNEWMVCCSASAGPAFEGSGVRHGMRAAGGAIEKLWITESGEVQYETIGGKPPTGICGSGLLDTIAALFKAGVIDRSGNFIKDRADDRLRDGSEGLEFVLIPKADTGIETEIFITQPDIENLMRSKAAIYAATSILAKSLQLDLADIQKVYLAGGFGNYLDVDHAIAIGMLPDLPPERISFVGNTSAAGARAALLSTEAFRMVETLASKMTYFDLMGNASFMEEFIAANFLPHTDLTRFPSQVGDVHSS